MNDRNQQGVTVLDNLHEDRFDVFVEDAYAGFLKYKDLSEASAGQRIFYHTEVFDTFEGRGLAGILTRAALETSVREGHRIVAVCPYVKRWLSTHRDFDDATDPVRPQHLQALG
ncbi:GNAT family N-acetyltransferase [Georgenia wangjunii]|uniref:GNAT family N-acetyltransferase n=1 Tax=Georgenia wangjunii TaxID=3117730 RepID=UPI002F25F6B6